jgi:hypothetical protein
LVAGGLPLTRLTSARCPGRGLAGRFRRAAVAFVAISRLHTSNGELGVVSLQWNFAECSGNNHQN